SPAGARITVLPFLSVRDGAPLNSGAERDAPCKGRRRATKEEEEQGGGRKGATVGARPVSRAVLKHEALPAGWRGQEEAPRGRRPRAAPWRQPSTLSR
ncbi:unnamed protein product, partial [Prorocentrum cordatum]